LGGLRLLLIVGAFAGMVTLSIIGFNYGGAGGLIGGALGFVFRLGGPGLDWGERLGNGFVGALMGMPLGFLGGGLYYFFSPQIIEIINAPQ
jgi:hypothetical protein